MKERNVFINGDKLVQKNTIAIIDVNCHVVKNTIDSSYFYRMDERKRGNDT